LRLKYAVVNKDAAQTQYMEADWYTLGKTHTRNNLQERRIVATLIPAGFVPLRFAGPEMKSAGRSKKEKTLSLCNLQQPKKGYPKAGG